MKAFKNAQIEIDSFKAKKEMELSQSIQEYDDIKKVEFQTKENDLCKLTTNVNSMRQLTEQVSGITMQNQEKKMSLSILKEQLNSLQSKEKITQKSIDNIKSSLFVEHKSYLMDDIIQLEKLLNDMDRKVLMQQNPIIKKKKKIRSVEKNHANDHFDDEFGYIYQQ